MEFDVINQELKGRVRTCETPEEVLMLASAEGITLSDAEFEQIAGGGGR